MKSKTLKCQQCNKSFTKPQTEYRRSERIGRKHFCSSSCSSKYTQANRPRPRPNVTCALCSVRFYLAKSKLLNSKSGLFFCCRTHKDQAQRIGGIKAIHPSHYGDSISDYRLLAFRNFSNECAECGYDKHKEVLCVHHIDHDRTNNSLDNLIILCPTCHVELHYLNGTGFWRKRNALED